MNTINNIFSKNNILNQPSKVQKIRYNRDYLITKDIANEFNTYLNFGVFPVYADTTAAMYDENLERTEASKAAGTPGVRSLFNRAGAVLLGSDNGSYNVNIAEDSHIWRINNNVPLMDSPKSRKEIRKNSGCSIRELVEASSQGILGQETYSYSDFMFCKHLGRISNNYMITLRRFPLPVDDFIGSIGEDMDIEKRYNAKNASSIGCMITWLGVSGNEMSSILKYNYKMPFALQNSERQDMQQDADQQSTILNGIFSVFDPKYREQYNLGYADIAGNTGLSFFGIKSDALGNAPYKEWVKFEDRNKVYGPVDAIKSTYIRSSGGLEFNQSFTLVFEYELKSYNGINGRQAMLDLISNILNVTYTTGTFWGGGYKGFAAHQSNIFANLNIFKTHGSFTEFVDNLSDDLSELGKTTAKNLGFVDKDGKFSLKEGFKDKDGKFSLKEGFREIFQYANSIGGMIMSGMLNKFGRPQKAMYNSLLSPAPIGFWHVTIGNPRHPIMSIGNMIITDCSIEHQGPLGLDDFPTGLKVTVQLDRGKPRDLRDIEKLYMQGNDRIYTSMSDKVFDMYKNSEEYKIKKKQNSLKRYNPVTNIATVKTTPDEKYKTTIDIGGYENILNSMAKYFGTRDSFSIYIPATEQEFGSSKNKNAVGENKK